MYEPIKNNKFYIERRIECNYNNNKTKNNKANYDDEKNIRKFKCSLVQTRNHLKMSKNVLFLTILIFGIFLNSQFGYTHGLIVHSSSNNNNGEFVFLYNF